MDQLGRNGMEIVQIAYLIPVKMDVRVYLL